MASQGEAYEIKSQQKDYAVDSSNGDYPNMKRK